MVVAGTDQRHADRRAEWPRERREAMRRHAAEQGTSLGRAERPSEHGCRSGGAQGEGTQPERVSRNMEQGLKHVIAEAVEAIRRPAEDPLPRSTCGAKPDGRVLD